MAGTTDETAVHVATTAAATAVRAPARAAASFALDPAEPVATGVSRVAIGQLNIIAGRLTEAGGPSPEGVHESRKSLKRLRALSRLARPALGEARYRATNAALRDAAGHLAGARDAEVMLATLEALVRRHPGSCTEGSFDALRARLVAERGEEARSLGDAGAVTVVMGELQSVPGEIATWLPADTDFAALEPGLRRMYAEGRERYRGVRKHATTDGLHDWRKRVKDLRYMSELLGAADPPGMRRLGDLADRLGETLGDDHDLGVLAAIVRADDATFADPAERKLLLRLIRRRRAALQRRALRLGGRLYRRRPGRFGADVARAWAAAASAAASA